MPERSAYDLYLPIMDLRQWVIWRFEQRNGQPKPTKVPYQPARPGLRAASTRPSDWGTYQEARAAEHTGDGIGFVFASGGGYVGIDLDDCRDPETGKIERWAQELVDRFNSYTEISPSGRGLHIYVRGELPDGGRKRGNVEIYDRGRYFTFTANPLPGSPLTINDRQNEILELCEELAPEGIAVCDDRLPEPIRLDDADVIRLAMSSHSGEKFRRLWNGDITGYPSQSEAEMALASMLAFWTRRDKRAVDRLMRQSGLYRPKWDERHYADGRTYGEVTVERAVALTTEVFGGNGAHGTLSSWGNAVMQVDPETGEVVVEELTGRVLLGQAIREGAPEVQWWVEPVIVHGRIHMIYGEPESGKTILVLSWLLDVITRGHNVLFIDEESGLVAIAGLLQAMGADPDLVDQHVHYFPFPGIDKSRYAALLAYADKLEPALCIFDSLTDMLAVAGLDENSGIEVTSWMLEVAQALARRPYEPGVVLVDHVTKDTSNVKYSVASRAKKAKSDVLWYVDKKSDFDQNTTAHVELHRHKNRPGVLPKKITYVVGGEDGRLICEPFDPSRHEVLSWPIGSRRMLEYLVENGGEALTRDIARVFAVSRETVGTWGRWLLSRGLVERFGQSVAAGFRVSEKGWQSVNPDAIASGESVNPRGLTLSTHGDDSAVNTAEQGWKSVNPDAFSVNPDAIASSESVNPHPPYKGGLTLSTQFDASAVDTSEEEDPWN